MRCFLGIDLNNITKTLRKVKLPAIGSINLAKGYHITLAFLGELEESLTNKLIEELDSFRFKQFELTADKILAFPNLSEPELYALGFSNNSDLINLHRHLIKLITIPLDKLSPHITLLRKEKLSPHFKESHELYSNIKSFKIKVKEFGLYKSEPEKGMNSYKPLKIIKLD